MLNGECPSCGKIYFGWVLRDIKQGVCDQCNVELEIMRDGQSGTEPISIK